MNRRSMTQHVHKLGLDNIKLDVDILISRSGVEIWDDAGYGYRDINPELIRCIENAKQFDYEFFCMLVGSLGMDVKDALEISLS